MNEERDTQREGEVPAGQENGTTTVPQAGENTPENRDTTGNGEAPGSVEAGGSGVSSGSREPSGRGESPAMPEKALPVLAFDYGKSGADRESRGNKKTFALLFCIFGGACILLLLLTFALGNAGFKIIRQVNTERTVYVREYDSTSGLLTPNEVADLGRKSTVTILVKKDSGTVIGSGFVYSADGYIVTNHHVIEDLYGTENAVVQVILADGTALDASLIGSDENSDVGVLRIPPEKTPAPVAFGSSAALLTGDAVAVIGTPYRMEMAGTATFGSVSDPKRALPITDTSGNYEKKMVLVQTDASINPGNSGGPMFDMYGRVVGVAVMKVAQVQGTVYEGVGFALPIDGVRTVADEIIRSGTFTGKCPYTEGRLLMGVTGHGGQKDKWYMLNTETGIVASSDEEMEGYYRMPETGIYVTNVDGADAKVKLCVGDVILRADGVIVRDTRDLISAVNRHFEGESIRLTVYRNGQTLEVSIVLTAA